MKNKKLIFGVLSGVAAFSTVLALGNVNQITGFVSAEECGHTGTVEHYVGNENQNFAGGPGYYVDHYSCCDCHTVWADEARTTVLGNSVEDRTKIELSNIDSYKFQWDFGGVPYYSNELGYYYEASLLGQGGFDGNGAFYIETISAPIDASTYKSVKFTFFNDTKYDLNIHVMNIDANASFSDHYVTKGTSVEVTLSVDQYNTVSANGAGGRTNGYQIWFAGLDTTITAADKVRITTPTFIEKSAVTQYTTNMTGQNYGAGWESIPHNNGVYSLSADYGMIYFDPRTNIPENNVLTLNFKNDGAEDITVTIYHDVIGGSFVVPAHNTKKYDIAYTVWNAPVTGEDSKIKFRLSTGAVELNLTLSEEVNYEANFLAELDAVELNDLMSDRLYLKSVQENLVDILERIHTHFGAEIPTSIRNHKNYIDYAAASTYQIWDYGNPNLEVVEHEGLDMLQVTAVADGEQGMITRKFTRFSNNSRVYIDIYNFQDSDRHVDIHNGYAGDDKWMIGGRNALRANAWTTLSFDKSIFSVNDEVGFIFQGNAVGDKYIVSPVYEYAIDSELTGDVLYSNTITVREADWAAASNTSTKYGTTYDAYIADSAYQDPEWKCSLLYLNGTTTVDADKYSYVKFYVYNATDLNLYISLKNLPSQYNFDESGNGVPMNEWKEFLVPATIWNQQNSDHLEIIFGSGQVAHHGHIYVSQFVGVAK
jgi:hypothetical protein